MPPFPSPTCDMPGPTARSLESCKSKCLDQFMASFFHPAQTKENVERVEESPFPKHPENICSFESREEIKLWLNHFSFFLFESSLLFDVHDGHLDYSRGCWNNTLT